MTTIQIIQFILEILLLGLAFYIAFFKSYFQEKGKNLATKEDIGEITQTVEKIKNQISFSTQSKLSLKTEERNSVVACYEKYNYWLNSIVDVYFSDINEENKIRLKEVEDKLNDAKFQFEMAEARMQIFIHNKDISEKLIDLRLKTVKLQQNCERYMDMLNAWLLEMQNLKAYADVTLPKNRTV